MEGYAKEKNRQIDVMQALTSIVKQYVFFHLIMLVLLVSEAALLLFLLYIVPHSYFVAIALALFLVSLFSYFILLSYFETKRPEQYRTSKENFLSNVVTTSCDIDDHFSIGRSCFRFSNELGQKLEASKQKGVQATYPLKFFAEHLFFYEKYTLQELFILEGIYAYHNMIKASPTDLKGHTALANAYLLLANLYLQGINSSLARKKGREMSRQKQEKALKMAIEELKILDDYAPSDPWVHAHLASCYHNLNWKEEEVKEYEILKNLCPEDGQILGKLGKIYFELGWNAKAMRIYDKLKKIDEKEAKTLIHFYDLSLKESIV